MADSKDKNYISVWEWMGIMLVTAIPCVGLVLIIVLAFVGGNETRKNYFRALILWCLVALCVGLVLALLGQWPQIEKQIHDWTSSLPRPK